MSYNITVDEIMADIMNANRNLIVENYVDEYLLAEKDILTEATTTADKMLDLSIDAGFDDESQYLEDDEEINALIDSEITDDIEGEGDLFQDTIDELNDEEDFIEDVEDVIVDYDDLESLIDDDDIDYLISSSKECNY